MNKILTVQEMQKRLAEMTYFPGWTMEIYEGFAEGPHFKAHGLVDDSVNVGEKVPLDIHSPIPPQLSMDNFDLWVHWRLGRAWKHESMEWLKVNGKPLFDPHKECADRDIY